MIKNKNASASFRDPSGFIYFKSGTPYRQINKIYKKNYNKLISSGLYQMLTDQHLLIPHDEIENVLLDKNAYKIIKPHKIPFISYPYEWSYSQLKDAALTTLKIQLLALEKGLTLKDSSAYNIQFLHGKPILIDTLSFEKYQEGHPWTAYRQFCQHFLAPLALMHYVDVRLGQLMKIFIDGIPLDLTSHLLPFRTFFKFSLLMHIHLHARSQKKYANKPVSSKDVKISKQSLKALITNLQTGIHKLHWKKADTEWSNYYQDINYSSTAFEKKKQIVNEMIELVKPSNIWDLGANEGTFSRIAANQGIETISFDIDPDAVEKNYQNCRKKEETHILPLLLDLTNPTPGIGWMNIERDSFINRAPVDLILALALIHHLAISNNLPFKSIASFFASICEYLIIEFVPKQDSQVQRLLLSREDIFDNYTKIQFEEVFSEFFNILKIKKINETERILYLMKKQNNKK